MKRNWLRSPWGLLGFVLAVAFFFIPVLAFAADAAVAAGPDLQDLAGKFLDFSKVSFTGLGGQSVGIFTMLEDGVMPYLVGNLAWLRPVMPMVVSFILWLAGGIHDGASWGTILKGTLGTGLGSMVLHNALDKVGGAPGFIGNLVVQVLTKGSMGKPGPISPDTYEAMRRKGSDVSRWNPDGSVKNPVAFVPPVGDPALAGLVPAGPRTM